MSVVRLENIRKTFGGSFILDGFSLRVEEGERIGLIGRNGTGKTTVFRLITGELEPDGGAIERMRRARAACLAQMHHVAPNTTVFETVLHTFQELIDLESELTALEEALAGGGSEALARYSVVQEAFVRRGGYEFRGKAKRVLHGLGFSTEDFDLPFHALSGGQRTRLMLALVLLQDADLLLLDEPENHLDLRAREWLEEYLQSCGKSVVVISHDRRLLNSVVQRIVEIDRGASRSFAGNYSAYLREKALIREQHQKAYERQQELLRKEQAWVERFRYKASKARQVQSRVRRIEKMEVMEAPPPEAQAADFSLGEVVRSGAVVLAAEHLTMAYGPLRLYEDLSFEVCRGERVGIIGPNGSGKTTLLRHVAGQIENGSGTVRLGHKVSAGFFDQHHEVLNPEGDVLSEVLGVRPDLTPTRARSFLGKLLFVGDDVFKPVSVLSGGERARVALARLMLSDVNLLLLDEPTNHLDIASREVLEAALAEFDGAIMLISHDRVLIDRLVDKLIVIEGGCAQVHLGNYSAFREKEQAEQAAASQPARTEEVLRIREQSRRVRASDKERERETRRQRRRLEQLEAEIESLEEMVGGYDEKFAAADPADYVKVQSLKEEYDGLHADLRAMYEEWENLVESLDGL
ncbi:MAG: ABC-F family ATP-binding cassette domain-containing protein [Candidatus Hydrogenedentes bacterium]|nr:ABC-F family ATP-binding cassette domain-containing protein [Candidatus Hydrogenedentota bacterium]